MEYLTQPLANLDGLLNIEEMFTVFAEAPSNGGAIGCCPVINGQAAGCCPQKLE